MMVLFLPMFQFAFNAQSRFRDLWIFFPSKRDIIAAKVFLRLIDSHHANSACKRIQNFTPLI